MNRLGQGLCILVALLHFGFGTLEAVFWTRPLGLKIFGMTAEVAEAQAVLAMNQGFYNGILGCGLLWTFALEPRFARQARLFFLLSIIAAGIFGGLTAKFTIIYIQALPALLAALVVYSTKLESEPVAPGEAQ